MASESAGSTVYWNFSGPPRCIRHLQTPKTRTRPLFDCNGPVLRRGMSWPEFNALPPDEQCARITGRPIAEVMRARLAKMSGAALLSLAVDGADQNPQEAECAISELDARVLRLDAFRRITGGLLGRACCDRTREDMAGNYIADLVTVHAEPTDILGAVCKMGTLVAFVLERADEIQYRPSGPLHAALIFEIFGLPRFMPDVGGFGPVVAEEVLNQRVRLLMCDEQLED